MAYKSTLALAISLASVASYAEEAKDSRIEEVIVFGQRSDNTLADTGSSVKVFTAKNIHNGKDNIDQLLEFTPNISVFGGNGGTDGAWPGFKWPCQWRQLSFDWRFAQNGDPD